MAMVAIWHEIVPNDQYRVQVVRPISPAEAGYLTHLYQPLIGPIAVSLYLTLLEELPTGSYAPQEGTHRWLMCLLALPLDQIVKARQRLEAVGLLRTMRYEGVEGERLFEYKLIPPLPPSRFFEDDILSIMLLNRTGKSRYKQLRKRYSMPAGETGPSILHIEKTEITKAFDEVFLSLAPSELDVQAGSETGSFFQEVKKEWPLPDLSDAEYRGDEVQANSSHPIRFNNQVDFAYLQAVSPKWTHPQSLSGEMFHVLEELAYLYGLENEELARLIQEPSVYDSNDRLDPALLRNLVKQWYQQRGGNTQSAATMESALVTPNRGDIRGDSPASQQTEPVHISDRHKAHVKRLEDTPPLILLEEYQGGGKVSIADQKIIEELLEEYLLPPGVVNVLLEYVMYTNDKQLPKPLITKIAAHWKRLKISSVQEAQTQAKQLYLRGSSDTSPQPPRRGSSGKKRNNKQEQLPAWVVEQLEQEKRLLIEKRDKDPGSGIHEKQERIAELLKELRK